MQKPTFIRDDYKHSDKFNGGSRLVLGTAGLGGIWGKVDEEESIDAILYALEHGVEVIDTAPSYNKAEEYIGKALQQWRGNLPFISTKIGRLQAKRADEVYVDYSPEAMRKSMEQSLELLGVDYIDLLFLHEPQLVPIKKMDLIIDTLRSFQEEGIVGMLGIGGNPVDTFWPYARKEIFDVVSTFLKIDASTLEGFQHDIPKYKSEDLGIYAASSLHMGLLGSKFEDYVENPPDTEWIRQDHVENAIKVKQIAEQNNMSLTELSLQYLFSMKEADRVVLGSTNMEELRESLQIWEDDPLTKEIFDEVTEVLVNSLR
jgi:aryl-alcohol dehydrogenase-like predicted oxidoreductase